jgi:hypothetical protein
MSLTRGVHPATNLAPHVPWRGSLGNQLQTRENVSSGNRLGVSGVRLAGTVPGQSDQMWFLLCPVLQGVQEAINQVADEAFDPGSVCH